MYNKLWFGLVVALLASFLAGCSTVESRIKSNPQIYTSLSAADQALVRQGQIREGMSKAAVFLAWGNPDRIQPLLERFRSSSAERASISFKSEPVHAKRPLFESRGCERRTSRRRHLPCQIIGLLGVISSQ